jgi:hypothetical protein
MHNLRESNTKFAQDKLTDIWMVKGAGPGDRLGIHRAPHRASLEHFGVTDQPAWRSKAMDVWADLGARGAYGAS